MTRMQWEYKYKKKYIIPFIGIQNQCILVSLAGLNLVPHFSLIQNMPFFSSFLFIYLYLCTFAISSKIFSLKFLILVNSFLED